MARTAKGNQVRKSVGFFVSFRAKSTKWSYVVNVKSEVEFRFGNTTTLTFVLVALARFFALGFPIRASVVLFTTLPIRAIWAGHVLRHPRASTGITAKLPLSIGNMRRGTSEFFAANSTCAINAIVRWIVFANAMRRLPLAKANTIAKVLRGEVISREFPFKQRAAVIASESSAYFSPNATLINGAAKSGTELSRAIAMPHDLYAALFASAYVLHKKYLPSVQLAHLSRACSDQWKAIRTLSVVLPTVNMLRPRQLNYNMNER
jgi:hypothetical protein